MVFMTSCYQTRTTNNICTLPDELVTSAEFKNLSNISKRKIIDYQSIYNNKCL